MSRPDLRACRRAMISSKPWSISSNFKTDPDNASQNVLRSLFRAKCRPSLQGWEPDRGAVQPPRIGLLSRIHAVEISHAPAEQRLKNNWGGDVLIIGADAWAPNLPKKHLRCLNKDEATAATFWSLQLGLSLASLSSLRCCEPVPVLPSQTATALRLKTQEVGAQDCLGEPKFIGAE